MSAKFSAYIGIDYSGAATPMSRSATIQVYEGRGNSDPGLVSSPASATNKHRCLLYTSPSPRDQRGSRMPSSA